jgi:GAF domain-containing protein/HAMP domain-containing protein
MGKKFSLDRVLSRTGGWYIIIAVVIAQLISSIGALPGIFSVQANASEITEQFKQFGFLLLLFVIASDAILLAMVWYVTPTARKQLDTIINGRHKPDPQKELIAWNEITGLTWKYGGAAVVVYAVVQVLPAYLAAVSWSGKISSPFQPASINSPAPTYVFLGGTVAMLGSIFLAILLIERFSLPARLALLPKDFESQLKGRVGILLVGKLEVLVLALIMVGILLVAPIGYQQAIRILYAEVSSFDVFGTLRSQTILFSVLALLLGASFSYFVFRAISDPISDLIKTFDKIEQGDLSQRVPVSATDELGIVAMQFNRMVSRLEELQNTLESQVAERTKQLRAMNEVARVAASSLDPNELLSKVVNLFTDQFGYYYAAIYLLDPSEKWAELREATGDAGSVLKQNHHRLEIAGRNMVGTSIREKSPRIAQIASEEKQRYENPLLPYTRSEAALPLIAGDRVLGSLNIQSTREADFNVNVVETMQSMAGQLAIALENARLFQDARQNIHELRAIQQQYLLQAWNEFSAYNEGFEYEVGDQTDTKSKKIEIPISLRDQTLGQIMLEGSEEWTPEQESLVNAVATQAAIALENARLVSESRQVAMRERMLAEINSKIWSSTTIDGVLQVVVKELGRRLDASSATIELHVDEDNG